jgi:type I restriction enzyme, S subunit
MTRYLERPLGDVLARANQSTPVITTASYSIVGIYSFGKGLIKRDVIGGADTTYRSLTLLRTGQLVMSKLNAWEGALSFVTDDFDGTYVSPEYPVFEIDRESADASYMRHLVSWPKLWEKLTPRGSMVRRKRTSPETLLAATVPLPDKIEQRRVADRLDSLIGRADSVWELRARLFRLQDSLHESLVGRSLKNADESVRLGDVLAFERTPIAIDADSVYRTVGVRSFGKGLIHHSPAKGEDLSKLSYFQFRAGALALSNLMAWEGGIAVTTQENTRYIASNRFFFYLPTGDRVNASYLRYFLLSRRGQALVGSACSAGAERNRTLGRKRFEALEIPLPPRAEQDRVARILDSLAERLRKAHTDPALDALRPAILNAAFTGQL